MKTRRLQYSYRDSASKLHRAVGEALRDSVFANFRLYQEYPVNRINPDFPDGRCKFDWVILDLKIVLECHGTQHYICTHFGGDVEKSIVAFEKLKQRDEAKKEAALSVGFSYIVIPYSDLKNIDPAYILALLHMYPIGDCPISYTPQPQKPSSTPYQLAMKEKARLFTLSR